MINLFLISISIRLMKKKNLRKMKKFCFLVLCLTVSVVVYGATIPRAILSHNGVLTQYESNLWLNAFDDAAEGDIIYLTPGSFSGDLTITKAVSVIGSGIALSDAFFSQDELETAYGGCCPQRR